MRRLVVVLSVLFSGCKLGSVESSPVAGDFPEVGVKFARALAALDDPAARP